MDRNFIKSLNGITNANVTVKEHGYDKVIAEFERVLNAQNVILGYPGGLTLKDFNLSLDTSQEGLNNKTLL